MSTEIEQDIQSSRSLPNNVSSKQQVILQGDDSTVTHSLRGNEVHIIPSVASSVSLASGRGSTSSRVTSKPISKREWDLRNPTGHIIAVSSQGRYLAYVIRGPTPGQSRTSDEPSAGDRIRVCNRRTASKGLLSGLMGSTLDLAFSYDRDPTPLLAAVDDVGCVLVVRVVENEQQTVLTFQPVVSVFPPGESPKLSSPSWRRVVWSPYVRCIDTDAVPDLGQSLIVTSESKAELWRLDIISRLAGGRQSSTEPLLLSAVTNGRYDVTEHQMPITDAVLSCDGEHLIVGTTSLDGFVNFLQLDTVDDVGGEGYNVTVLQHWRPHGGRPVYSLCFLDNVEEPLSTMWKYALTLSQPEPSVGTGFSEIRLWHCQTWECLQTLSFQPSLQTSPSLRLQLSLTGDFAFLTDINRAVLYLLHLEQTETTALCSSLTELLLASECLDFALLKVGFKQHKSGDHLHSNGNDDQENVSSFLLNGSLASANEQTLNFMTGRSASSQVTGHLIVVSPKLIHELTIKLTGLPSKGTETASPQVAKSAGNISARNDGLSLSDVGRHLVTPDLLNRSLTSAAKNSPGAASTLTGVTSLPLNNLNATEQDDQQSRPATISLFPGGININSPHTSQPNVSVASVHGMTNSSNFSPQQVDNNGAQKYVVTKLFDALRGPNAQSTDASQNTDSNRLHRPSPPPSDTSMEVADILNSGRPIGGLEQAPENEGAEEEALRLNGGENPGYGGLETQASSTTPQLLAPGALLGSAPDSVTQLPVGRASQRTPQAAPVANAMTAEQMRQLTSELTSFRETVSNLVEGQRSMVSMLTSLSERINQLEMRDSSITLDAQSIESSTMPSQLGEIVGRQATSRLEMMLAEAISECRNQLDATGRQAVADVKTTVSQQVAERVQASMDVFRHALQGVVTSRPVVDAVATATAEAANHAVATSSREVFTSTVLPSIDRSVQSMLTQLGDTLAQGTAQYEERLRGNLDSTLTAHQAAIQQQYSDIEGAIISRVENLLDRKFNDHFLTYEQRTADAQKALQNAVLRAVSERMEALAKQTATTVDQAVAGAVARSRPVTPAPMQQLTSTADLRNQISGFIRRAEWNSAFQTALGATDLPTLVWLCQQVPIATIFKGNGPCPLTQAVLLSFIQQMTFDLTSQSELKADWLSEAVMALEASDPLVSRNLAQIARGAEAGIERYLTATQNAAPGTLSAGSARVAKSLRMVQTIIRSLVMSSGSGASKS